MSLSLCMRGATRSPLRFGLLLAIALPLGCSSKPSPSRMELAVGSGERARATILERVADADRRERALQLLDQIVSAETALLERSSSLRAELFELNADYDADRAAFDSVYETLAIARTEALDDLLAPLSALEVVLQPEEWSALVETLEDSQGSWSEAQ